MLNTRRFEGVPQKVNVIFVVLDLQDTPTQQLKALSQRERDLILKISGYSPEAWGSRGVFLGSDLSHAEWSAAVDKALASFERSPYVLQALSIGLADGEGKNDSASMILPFPPLSPLSPGQIQSERIPIFLPPSFCLDLSSLRSLLLASPSHLRPSA